MTAAMFVFGILLLFSGLGVVVAKRSLHSAMFLVLSLFLVAAHFALLSADFAAAIQVMVYAGAIMVLVVFVIMLLGIDQDEERLSIGMPKTIAALISSTVAALVGIAIFTDKTGVATSGVASGPLSFSSVDVGLHLFREQMFAFQITGVLLLAAVVGAVILAYDKKRPLAPERGLKAKREIDLTPGGGIK